MKCPICKDVNPEKAFKNSTINKERDVIFCNSCNLFFVDPMPTANELRKLYEKEWSWDYGMNENSSFVKSVFRIIYEMHQQFLAQERANHLFSLVPDSKSKILEIGSGNGAFLKKITSKYGRVEGIEPSLRNDFSTDSISIKKKTIDEHLDLSEKYDAICMYMVLEHLPNPVQILNTLIDYLNPKGYLVIEVPYSPHKEFKNLDTFELNKVFNNVHLFHYSRDNVNHMASRVKAFLNEFQVIRKREFINGYNVFSVYPNASKEPLPYKLKALVNLLILYAKGLTGLSIHESINEKNTPFGDGYWIRFVLQKTT
jgi:SAM-dependent methyltransferase